MYRNNRIAMLMAMAGAMSMSSPHAEVLVGREPMPNYSIADLRLRNTSPRTAPKASQAKNRRAARRMHCGHIKNLRLRA